MALIRRLVPTAFKVKLRHHFMRGDAVYCPVCDNTGIAFLPSGEPLRPHAQCAFCGSLERTRLTWIFMQRQGLPKEGSRILHIAPERGLRDRFRATHGVEYIAGDKFDPGYPRPEGTIWMDITDVPFPNDHFDLVICSHVLEHVPDDRRAIAEFFRVMRKGSTGFLIVPFEEGREHTFEDPSITDPAERARVFGQHDHVRIYGRDYSDRLVEAGFEVQMVDMIDDFTPAEQFRMGLRRSPIHVVRKN